MLNFLDSGEFLSTTLLCVNVKYNMHIIILIFI